MVDQSDYISALSDLPQAVFVITCFTDDGEPHGFTATSVTSVSVDPPTLLVCVNENNRGARIYQQDTRLGMHVLGANQESVSNRFAGKGDVSGAEKFKGIGWDDSREIPLIDRTADVFVGNVDRMEPYHDHIMVGVEIDRVINRNRAPLIYMASAYHKLQVDDQRLDSS